jgi:hypothetical protein
VPSASDADSLGTPETAIVARFAAICPLLIVPESIAKREPPEPDILCQTAGRSVIALELVEVIDADFARKMSDQWALSGQMREVFETLPDTHRAELESCLGNALIHVEFAEKLSLGKRRQSIPGLLDWLVRVPPDFQGERSEPMPAVRWLRIVRGRFVGPCFDVDAAGAVGDPTIDRLTEKFGKTYQTPHPIELLAHYRLHPMLPDDCWLPRVRAFVEAELPASPFQRVWVYDGEQDRIAFVYPAPGEPAGGENAPSELR